MEMVAPQCLTFRPRDDELIDLFLGRKIAGQPPLAAACFIHELDVYSVAPEQLVAGLTAAPGTGLGDARVWYFFSPVRHCAGKRKARTVGGAGADGGKMWWHSEAGQKTVEGSATAGCFQKFSFKVKTASGVVKPGWLMVEYSIGDADLVLCKVYRSPRAVPPRPRVVSSSTTTAALSESFGSRKRKAEEEHPEAPPPFSARRQMTDEEDDDALAFAESVERDLTSSEYHAAPGGELANDHHPTQEAPPPCSDWQQTPDKEEDDNLLLFAESLECALTTKYHLRPAGELDDHHPAEEAPPCSDQQQTMEEEEVDDVVLFAESLKSTLTPEYHHGLGGELDDYHPAEEAPEPCIAQLQMIEEMLKSDGAAIPLQHFEHDQMWVDYDMSALLPLDFNELDLFGGEPGDHQPGEEAPPPCSDQQQTMDEEEDDDVVLFAESLKSTLTPEYHHGPGGKLDDHHPAEEAPQPCSDWQQMMDEEEDDDVVLFAESLKSTLTPDFYHGPGGDVADHHPAEEACQPCSAQQQMTDELVLEMEEMLDRDGATIPLQPFEFDEQDLMSVDGNMSALLPFDFNELDLFGGEPGVSPPCAPPAEPEPEENAAVELVQTATTVHDPCPGDATCVADAFFDVEGVQLDEPAPGEFISGLPCPPFDPAFIAELISASGEVVMPWPAVPTELTWLCGDDSLSSASLQAGSFGVSPRPSVC